MGIDRIIPLQEASAAPQGRPALGFSRRRVGSAGDHALRHLSPDRLGAIPKGLDRRDRALPARAVLLTGLGGLFLLPVEVLPALAQRGFLLRTLGLIASLLGRHLLP
jgi:hypothetical protein